MGPFEATINMGAIQLPLQRNGRVPQYARNKLLELHRKFDELENQGVFARPESLGITAEYLNPSFLVKKTSGGFRLVTSFAEVGRYSKPQPSLMPDVDSTLRSIARWKYLIISDLTNAFYQILLSKSSMKYRGVRVYTRWQCLDLTRPLRNLCFVSLVIVFKTLPQSPNLPMTYIVAEIPLMSYLVIGKESWMHYRNPI